MSETIQRASLLKRAAAYLLDLILLSILVVGIASLLSLALHYDATMDRLNGYYDQYAAEYGIDFNIGTAEYEALSAQEQKVYEDAISAMNTDEGAVASYNKVFNTTVLIATVSVLASYLLLEFLIPLLLKNGQTVGKKIFSLGLCRENCVRVTTMQLFVRTILGKCTVGTMIPVMVFISVIFGSPSIVSLIVLFAIALSQALMVSFDTNHRTIQDRMAGTVLVDLPSQMVFDSEEHLLEYIKERHKEQVNEQPYF